MAETGILIYTAKTKNEIINQLYGCKELQFAAKNIMKGYYYTKWNEDLYQELFVYLCAMDESKLFSMYNKKYIYYFCVDVLKKQTQKGKFATSYLQFEKKRINNEHEELIINYQRDEVEESLIEQLDREKIDNFYLTKANEANSILAEIHWYDRKIYEMHVKEGKSQQKIARETTISLTSIHTTIKKVQLLIKTKMGPLKFI